MNRYKEVNLKIITWLIVIGIVSLISGSGLAAVHTVSSLPATLSYAGTEIDGQYSDTVVLSGSLSSSTVGLVVTGHHIVILLDDGYIANPQSGSRDTITFNTSNGDYNHGIQFDNSAHHIKIVGGMIRYGGGYTGRNNTCAWIQSVEDIFFYYTDMYASGTNGRCVGTGNSATPFLAYNLEFWGGFYESKSDTFFSGYNYDGAGMLIYPSRVEAPNYGVKIHDITFEGVMQFAVINGNRGGISARDNWSRGIYIYDNNIMSDAQNGTNTGDHWTTRNNYAILLYRCHEDVRVYNNTIRSGTTWGGCRGILFDETWGKNNNLNEIYNNDIQVWNGPVPDESASARGNVFGIRFRFGADRLKIYDNNIVVKADTDNATRHIGEIATGISMGMIDEERLLLLPDSVFVENNTVTSLAESGGVSCMGLAVQNYITHPSSGDPLEGIFIRNNTWQGNATLVNVGGDASGARGLRLENETFVKFDDNYGVYHALGVGGFRNNDADDNSTNDTLIDCSFINGADHADVFFELSQYSNIRQMRSVSLTTVDNSFNPISGIPTEAITIHDAIEVENYSTSTNTEGLSESLMNYYYEQDPGTDSTNFSHRFRATYAGQTIDQTYTDIYSRTVDTLNSPNNDWKLIITFGDGIEPVVIPPDTTLDTIPPDPVEDLGVIPGSLFEGSDSLFWTATGDDGTSGTATSYTIKYSTNPITGDNWDSVGVNVFNNPPTPATSGQPENVIIDQLTPGQTYYFGIIATDEAGNSSGIATTSGFSRGVLSPLMAADTIILDAGLGEATLFADTVGSYLNINYDFQLSTDTLFNNPALQTATNVTNQFASVTFSGLSSNVDYFCRVRAIAADQSVQSNWSEHLKFNLQNGIINSSAPAPLVNSPLDGDTITTLTPTLVIDNSIDPEGDILTYDFELYDVTATDLLSSAYDIVEDNQTTSWNVPDGILSDNSSYSWRARAFDGSLYSAWTDYSSFTVVTLGTGGFAEIPEVYAYPNPVKFAQGEQATFILPNQPSDLLIQTVSGETVLLKSGLSGVWDWNGKNESGIDVAMGVYLWYVNGSDFKGKIMVTP